MKSKFLLTLGLLIVAGRVLYAAVPAITSFSPASGPVGTLVAITGTSLSSPTAFTIGGATAIVISNTGTQLVGMVMPGAVTGAISLTTAGGTATGSNFTVTSAIYPNVQQGLKLVGTGGSTASNQEQGTSVALSADGNTAIVGAQGDDQGGSWIYVRSGGVWAQQGSKLMGIGASDDEGGSVAISADGNTVIQGDPAFNNNQGAAWVFVRNGVTWSEQGMLTGTNASAVASQGTSVSLSADGNTAVVGGNGYDSQGAVWVYTRSNGVWTQQGTKLVGTGVVGAFTRQGSSAAISADGNTIIEGGPGDNNSLGAAWIFSRSGGTWTQQGAKLVGTGIGGTYTAPGVSISNSPNQGASVAISADGNTVLVGGPDDNSTSSPEAGAVWVYTRSGATWTQQGAKLSGTGAVGSAMQGWSVSLSADGNTAIIGGSGEDNNELGAAWIFTRSGATWTQKGTKLVGTGSSSDAGQGSAVAISANGNTAIMGGPGDNGAVGAAWVFTGAALAPAIISFTPATGPVGTLVIITGTNLTGATAVSFGGMAATSFNVISDTQINAVAGAGASGSVSVTTPGGTVTLPGFTLITAPVISYSDPQTYTTGTAITALTPTNSGGVVPAIRAGVVTTFAGSGIAGATNGTGISASFKGPGGAAVDVTGNVYIVDGGNLLIRKISSAGVVTTLAGGGARGSLDGTGAAASFSSPGGLTVDAAGNVYVTDGIDGSIGGLIRKITAGGVVTTLAGSKINIGSANGTGAAASFNLPASVAADASGNIFVADYGNNLIRKITPAGVVSTFAGSGTAGSANGTGTSASFNAPEGVAVDAAGNVYVADYGNNLIRKITPAGVVSTLAGSGSAGAVNGAGTAASFNNLYNITVDANDNLYVSESDNLIRKITPAGVVTTLAGSGVQGSANGIGTAASFSSPFGISVDASGNLYVADSDNNLLRKVTTLGYGVSPALPAGLSIDSTGTIKGTPTTASPATIYTITANNSGGSSAANVSIAVTDQAAITFPALASVVYGSADISPGATSTNTAVPVTYSSSDTTVAMITALGKIHIVHKGTAIITASQSRTTVVPVTQTLTVTPAVLTITADNKSKYYSDDSPALTVSYAGFVNGETPETLSTQATASTTATNLSAAGTYPITASGAIDANYTFNYVAGALTVNPAPAPGITAMSTNAGISGTTVTLTGTYFTGATAVSFGGTAAASFVVNSSTSITAVVGGGASGKVAVTTTTGTGTIAGFAYTLILPPNNYKFTITSATCRSSSNGLVNITAKQKLSYTATITGNGVNTPYPFTDSVQINNLAAGTYAICITVAGQSNYQQCFTVVVTEPMDLSVYSTVNDINNSIDLALSGGTVYNIQLNDALYTTKESTINLPLKDGVNNLVVTTDRLCQGAVQRTINVSGKTIPYPDPFQNIVNLNLGNKVVKNVSVQIHSASDGTLVLSKQYVNQSGVLQLDVSNLKGGVYAIRLSLDNVDNTFKIIKK